MSSCGDVLGVDFVESIRRFLTLGTFNDFESILFVKLLLFVPLLLLLLTLLLLLLLLLPLPLPNTESELTIIDSVKFDVVNFWFKFSFDEFAFDTIADVVESATKNHLFNCCFYQMKCNSKKKKNRKMKKKEEVGEKKHLNFSPFPLSNSLFTLLLSLL